MEAWYLQTADLSRPSIFYGPTGSVSTSLEKTTSSTGTISSFKTVNTKSIQQNSRGIDGTIDSSSIPKPLRRTLGPIFSLLALDQPTRSRVLPMAAANRASRRSRGRITHLTRDLPHPRNIILMIINWLEQCFLG